MGDPKRPRIIKCLILGDSNVGKTSLFNQFANREFTSRYRPTIGADFASHQMEIDGEFYTLQIWDTAGQERYSPLGNAFYRGTECCFLVFDISNRDSLVHIDTWRRSFLSTWPQASDPDFPIVLIGNKSDLPKAEGISESANDYAEQYSMPYFEVSAKTADGVSNAFEKGVRETLRFHNCRAEKKIIEPLPTPQKVEVAQNKVATKGGCC